MYLISPDDIANILESPIVVAFWPSIIGTLFIFLLLSRGVRWPILPVFLAIAAYQADHLGII